jgi:SAM-dependent methyltransferase
MQRKGNAMSVMVGGKKIRRVGAREGYDRWSVTYDATPNPVVSMDDRCTLIALAPKRGERILDAGCGTGRHFGPLRRAGSEVFGIDFSLGMLRVARRRYPQVPVLLADLQKVLPIANNHFDAVLCSLVGEHLDPLYRVFREMHRILRPSGRLIFSVYHPDMAAAGIEANFREVDVEFRLGAYRHTVKDYLQALQSAGFVDLRHHEWRGDEQLVTAVPQAKKYLNFPILLILQGKK